ncbi:MAG TPA: glycosyltransferase family 4 protein [Nocardioidaceae bacterium]|nr:glycosyltransferase family 4 protein [Nocardioidaceae bacterium]
MRIGLVCPYSLDVPGGVQNHVRDLAEALIGGGHTVSVLAPADDDDALPGYVVPAGRAVPVPYNGSVARLAFGPLSATRVRRWLADGRFDVLHIHEPVVPSVSLLALWAASGPIVGTFHTSMGRSRAMLSAAAILRPSMEKLAGRIAVSEHARSTLVQHFGGEPVIIPNGLYVDRFGDARRSPRWESEGGTLVFLGRMDEPRKGLTTLLEALPAIVQARPGAHLYVAGRGDIDDVRREVPREHREHVTFLGLVDERTRGELLASADLYVAPNTGGESFGIILVEAMAAGAPVLASDLAAFRRVLDDGRLGTLFPVGDARALAREAVDLLADDVRRGMVRKAASVAVRRYDWSVLVRDIVRVYETVHDGAGVVAPEER